MGQILEYQAQSTEKIRRPIWVYAVAGIYLCLLLGLLCLPFFAGWDIQSSAGVEVTVAGFFLLGGSLLFIPIQSHRRRPLSRRSIWVPLIGSSLCVALLATAGGLAIDELLKADGDRFLHYFWTGVGAVWLLWLVVFGFMGRKLDPVSLNARLYKSVVAGSVLELLMAVPMHVIVRRRHECCAGMATGIAICLGVVIAVISLGPAVFLLFHRRWKQSYGKDRFVSDGWTQMNKDKR